MIFTANSTKKVSENLILKVSSELNKQIEILNCDCSKLWAFFESKNIEAYEKGIAKEIKKIESKVDVIFLAQASMEGAKNYLNDLNKDIFSSPEFGVKKLIENIKPVYNNAYNQSS